MKITIITEEQIKSIQNVLEEYNKYSLIGYTIFQEALLTVNSLEAREPEQCNWNYDDFGLWQTDCGQSLSFEMNHPEESVNFCQGCGKLAHFVESNDEGEQI